MIKINDIKVCLDCGMTVINGENVFFDRKAINYGQSKKGKRNAEKSVTNVSRFHTVR